MPARVFDFDADLPDQLYWDASFLVHATYPAGRYHRECYAFLDRLSDLEQTLSYVSALALDETVFALIQLRLAEDHPERGFWEVYHANSRVIQPYLTEVRALIERLSHDPRIRIVGQAPDCMLAALSYMEDYSLLPRDALHLTIMTRHGIGSLVTTDEDFLSVDDLRIHTCNPRILAR
jgi:predicted nucleic acid-binding protein